MSNSLRVIYLDDEPDLVQVFVQTLSRNGIEVKGFTESQKALAEALAHPPDVMVLDYRLPGMTGDQLALQLPPGIVLALVTGALGVNLKAQFAKIFLKPYELTEIRQFLEACRFEKKGVSN